MEVLRVNLQRDTLITPEIPSENSEEEDKVSDSNEFKTTE